MKKGTGLDDETTRSANYVDRKHQQLLPSTHSTPDTSLGVLDEVHDLMHRNLRTDSEASRCQWGRVTGAHPCARLKTSTVPCYSGHKQLLHKFFGCVSLQTAQETKVEQDTGTR